MNKFSTLIALILFCAQQNHAQQNCSNPVPVTICPSTYLANQTNSGMLNDAYSTCGTSGEDLVYRVNTTLATQRIYVSLSNVTGTLRLVLQTGTCGTGSCTYRTIFAGNTNWTFNVSGSTAYHIWIDAVGTVTYNIAFGGDTANTFISIPNTQGNLNFDASGCATPMFKPSKPFFQVSYNGVYQTDPMTLSPLFVNGTLCVVTFFSNTTGIEGIRQFDFYYNPLGFSSFTPSPIAVPGFYIPGNWVATSGLNKWTFTFYDSFGLGKGDFGVLPNTCLRYEFCFNVTPVSNSPVLTNIKDTARSDGFGAPFSGTVRTGCCPPGFANCTGASGSSPATSTHAFGFGFADPGALLPIVLLEFNAQAKRGNVEVTWITQSELNNDYFTIQKSADAQEWTTAAIVDGAGNSTIPLSYSYTDEDPINGTSYYRLKQTDFDGTTSYSHVATVNTQMKNDFLIYPNPTTGEIRLNASDPNVIEIALLTLIGKRFVLPAVYVDNEIQIDLSTFPKGIYILELIQDGIREHHKVILKD